MVFQPSLSMLAMFLTSCLAFKLTCMRLKTRGSLFFNCRDTKNTLFFEAIL